MHNIYQHRLYVAVSTIHGAVHFAVVQFVFVRKCFQNGVIVFRVRAAQATTFVNAVVQARRADTFAAAVVKPSGK